MSINKVLVVCLLPLLLMVNLFAQDPKDGDGKFDKDAAAIKEMFTQAVDLYNSGDHKGARQLTQKAYFSHFEFLEGGIRVNLGQNKAYAMEKQFGEIREAIKSEQPIDKIQGMMNSLLAEIDEVLPIIEDGHQLEAEKSDDGGLSASGIKADANSPWIPVYQEIVESLNLAKLAYNKHDKDGVLKALNDVKMNLYRNKKLEIAFRRYISQNYDQMIQQIIGNALTENIDMNQRKFNQHIDDIRELIVAGVVKLPQDSYQFAPVVDKTESGSIDFTKTVDNIKTKMGDVLRLYNSGKIDDAIDEAQNIYFDEYEGSGMEAKVGAIDSSMKLNTEASFSKIVALMQKKADVEAVQDEQNNLFNQLDNSLQKTGKPATPWDLFIFALTIILREGFEALIIVAAVVAYLVKTGNKNKLGIVYSSLIVAVILSFATAYLVNLIFTNAAGQSREVLEGATMLIAVILLFYVGFWLLSNAGAKKWSHYIKEHVSESLTGGDRMALWWTVFLAVYREGAETVLFYQVLFLDATTTAHMSMIGIGFVTGLVILIVAFFIFKVFSIKIPMKEFFIVTSIIIFYMSIVFTGKGVMELVEGKVFVPTIIDGIPTITWLGIYPYVESLVPQAILIILLIAGIIIMKKRQKKIENKSI